MKYQLKNILPSLILTILILILLEVISSAFLPLIGLTKYRVPFNVLIVLFIGFKVEAPYQAILIFIIQYLHSFFSIEGWAMGTIAGVCITLIISYLKDLIHFTSAGATIVVTQIFQTVWFLIVSIFIYIQTNSFNYILDKFWRFIPESILISLLAPFVFTVLDRIWNVPEGGSIGESA